jgi:putative aldouronate transport system substrate-binding protein
LALCVILPGAVFAGGQGEQPAATTAEQYELDWLFLCGGPDDRIEQIEAAANEILLQEINATINVQMVGWGDHKQKVDTLIASGEKLDLVFTAKWWSYVDWVSRGYFLPLNDLLYEYAPETVKILGEDVFIAGSQIDGVNYAVPTMKETCVPGGWVFNNKYLDQYGWDETTITTEADMTPWLRQIKEDSPDVIPFLTKGEWYARPYQDIASIACVYYDNRDRTVYNKWELPEVEDHLQLMHEWYEAGYIHPDATLDEFNLGDQIALGNFFINPQPLKGKNIKADELEATNPDPNADYVDQEAPNQRWVVTNHMAGSMQAIPVTSEDPARAMMFIDLLHTNEDLINIFAFGVEGVHWQHTDQEGIIELTEGNKWQGKLPQWMLGNVFKQYITTKEDPRKNKALREVVDTAQVNFTTGFYFDPIPVASQIAAVTNASAELSGGLNTGSLDPTEYLPQMIDVLNAAGAQDVVDEVQRQLDEWLADQE